MDEQRPIDDFVFTVLSQIQSGIGRAQDHGSESGFTVNPGGLVLQDKSGVLSLSKDGYICGKVEFDLSVSVEKADAAEGGFKLSLFGGGLSVGGKVENKDATVHKVKFFVPVEYPREKKV